MSFDWLAGLVFFATLTLTTMIGRTLAFRVPALQKMREMNGEADGPKLERQSYREAVRKNSRIGGIQALAFYILVLPFFVSLDPLPWWRYVVDIVAVLAIYDFSYYLVHRFLFHGKALRKVHALHHRAHVALPSSDSLYVHPLETLIGQGLYQLGDRGGGPGERRTPQRVRDGGRHPGLHTTQAR